MLFRTLNGDCHLGQIAEHLPRMLLLCSMPRLFQVGVQSPPQKGYPIQLEVIMLSGAT